MTKEEGWSRHQERVRRLLAAGDKKQELIRIRSELVAEGFSEEASRRIAKESWHYAKAKSEGRLIG